MFVYVVIQGIQMFGLCEVRVFYLRLQVCKFCLAGFFFM
jgi:hypothetical protein